VELYTLDSFLRRASVVDRFESMIWTERYSAWGDFELHLFSTPEMRRLLPAGTRLAMSESYRIMTVEFVENSTDEEGREMLKLTGRSLEALLEDRSARNSFADLTTLPKWILTGTPGDICRQIFDEICRTNVSFAEDEIPFLMPGVIFPPGNIPEEDTIITIELGLGTVYKAIKEICEVYDLGFRLIRYFDTSELYFDIYKGNDRTTLQDVLDPVVFAPDLDNLSNISEIVSISSYKNVAYVWHPVGVQVVTIDGVSFEISGFDRKVLTVDASDIDLPDREITMTQAQADAIRAASNLAINDELAKTALNKLSSKERLTTLEVAQIVSFIASAALTSTQRTDITAAKDASVAYNTTENAYILPLLQQRGMDELAKNRALSAFDGELPMNSPYPYEIAYQLGDLVEMRNSDGVTNQMRVMEQIFVSDTTGERAYPTLTIDRFITPGSWFSWDYNQTWENADGEWGTI